MFLCHFNNADAARPSFFEMIAQQQLLPSLGPALKYACTVFAQRSTRWEWAVRHFDELWTCGLLFIEHRCLEYYDASFAENFYGLKRVRVNQLPGKDPSLTRRDRNLSLFLLVVAPYIKMKLDQAFERSAGPLRGWMVSASDSPPGDADPEDVTISQGSRLREIWVKRLRSAFLLTYPYFNAAYEGLFFIYQLLYLFDHTRYYTPFLHLQRLEVKRMSMEDMVMQTQRTLTKRTRELEALKGYSLIRILSRLFLRGWHFLLDYAQILLPLSLFLFKFFEWWYAENRQPAASLPTPPPPEAPKTIPEGLALPSNQKLCALCNKERTNAAMLPTGYVFCYPCAFNYVNANNRCPVTFMPTNVDQIRKIYESS